MNSTITLAISGTAQGRVPSAQAHKQASTASPSSRLSPETREAILETIPNLRAFAISLTGSVDQADDLVQEAIVKGLSHIDSFQPGTNMQAWLFTILRNQFYTAMRRHKREVEDPEGILAGRQTTPPEQMGHLDMDDLRVALTKLPPEQREALLLVAAEGLSYEETAAICATRVGTIKSRINRARRRLAELLSVEDIEDIGVDTITRAALHA